MTDHLETDQPGSEEPYHGREVVGVVPAAGWARRLAPLPCSKEVYPIGFHTTGGRRGRPKVAAEYLLERMRRGGASQVYVVLRDGKWDIPAFLGDGGRYGLSLAYLVAALPYGVPFTADAARPFVRGTEVLFGFPDVVFEPADAFARLVEHRAATEADLVLGLFPTDRPGKMDMVRLDPDGRVQGLDIKPAETTLAHTWLIAAWGDAFTAFLHDTVRRLARKIEDAAPEAGTDAGGTRDFQMGDAIRSAIEAGLHIGAVRFDEGQGLDVGTPDDLRRAVQQSVHDAPPDA